ncbi:hypothetical protein QD336_00035 [Rhizobium sp. BR 250]
MTYLNGFHIVARSNGRDLNSETRIYKVVEHLSDNLIAQPVATGGEPIPDEACQLFSVGRLAAAKLFASYNAALKYDVKTRTGTLTPAPRVRIPS